MDYSFWDAQINPVNNDNPRTTIPPITNAIPVNIRFGLGGWVFCIC